MFDVYMFEKEALMVGRPKGILDAPRALQIVEFIEIKEIAFENGFNRFLDFTLLDAVNLSTADITNLTDRRRRFNPNDIHVKSAFMATNPLTLSAAHLYEKLLNSPRIEMRVFEDLQSAADWLAVKPDRLTL